MDLVTAEDIQLMQRLAQRVTAIRPDRVNTDASFGELAWIWGRNHAAHGDTWRRRLWFAGDELIGWGWASLPHKVTRSDGSTREVTGAYLAHQVHPDQPALLDEVIEWYGNVASGLEQTVVPHADDAYALGRWAAYGFVTDPAALGDTGSWTELNQRDLENLGEPVLPAGFRFRTADHTDPDAVVQAHVDAWAPSPYTRGSYDGLRHTATYRGDLHVLVEAPDGVMAASTIMWFDEVNRTVEFEPVGTHPDYRRHRIGTAMMWQGLRLARAAGATHATVACLGAPGHPRARGLYRGVGFRPFTRDLPLLKPGPDQTIRR